MEAIDRLEWQGALKPGFGGGVQLSGALERTLPFDFGAVALEADGLRPGARR